jgi:hypothetical protein
MHCGRRSRGYEGFGNRDFDEDGGRDGLEPVTSSRELYAVPFTSVQWRVHGHVGHFRVVSGSRRCGRGPEIAFVVSANNASAKLDETQVIEGIITSGASTAPQPATQTYDGLLSEAVERARRARAHGLANQTMTIMRDALDRALRQTGKRFRRLIAILAIGLVVVSGAAGWRIAQLVRKKQAIDRRIQYLEKRLQQSESRTETDSLITQLDAYEDEAEQLQPNLLYRLSVHDQDFVTDEIRRMMAEFGWIDRFPVR